MFWLEVKSSVYMLVMHKAEMNSIITHLVAPCIRKKSIGWIIAMNVLTNAYCWVFLLWGIRWYLYSFSWIYVFKPHRGWSPSSGVGGVHFNFFRRYQWHRQWKPWHSSARPKTSWFSGGLVDFSARWASEKLSRYITQKIKFKKVFNSLLDSIESD